MLNAGGCKVKSFRKKLMKEKLCKVNKRV